MKGLNAAVLLAAALMVGSTASAQTCRAPPLKQGMQYKVARALAIDAGFQTRQLPAYGYNSANDASRAGCDASVDLCNKYPEIEMCSGQGHCKMKMNDAYGNQFLIFTYGEMSNGSAGVTGFEMECKGRK